MSNRVTFQNTKFIDIGHGGREEKSSYGYRVYDDYGQAYVNTLEHSDLPRTPAEAMALITDLPVPFVESINVQQGLFFNGEWTDFTLLTREEERKLRRLGYEV